MDFLSNFLLTNVLPPSFTTPTFLVSCFLYLTIFTMIIYFFELKMIFQPLYHSIWYKYVLRRNTVQPELFTGGGDPNDWRSATRFNEYQAQVTTSDLDLNIHISNSRYFRYADFARYELMFQTGLVMKLLEMGIGFVVAGETIRFRKELKLGQQFTIRSRVLSWDKKACVVEQLFLVKEEVHAVLFVKYQPSVSKKMKEKNPDLAEAPLLYVMRNGLRWTREQVPDTKAAPKDVQLWLDSLNETYSRILGDKK